MIWYLISELALPLSVPQHCPDSPSQNILIVFHKSTSRLNNSFCFYSTQLQSVASKVYYITTRPDFRPAWPFTEFDKIESAKLILEN